jgi:hypothetical protein
MCLERGPTQGHIGVRLKLGISRAISMNVLDHSIRWVIHCVRICVPAPSGIRLQISKQATDANSEANQWIFELQPQPSRKGICS